MVDYSALSQRDDKLALELLEEHRQLFREIFLASTGPRSKPLATLFWSSENCAEICITLYVTRMQKNGQISDYA